MINPGNQPQVIAAEVAADLKKGSWIRKIFEQKPARDSSAQTMLDFSLGNPIFDPPEQFFTGLKRMISNQSTPSGMHRYMPNAGFLETREMIAELLTKEHQLNFTTDNVLMTVGAGGGLNVALKAILNPTDQVVVFTPYFMEYDFYVKNQGAKLVRVDTDENFQPDLEKMARAISYETKAVLINSPNNPTGAVYSQQLMNDIAAVINQAQNKYNNRIYLISDEPYRKTLYDNAEHGSLFKAYPHSIMVNSHSKDYGLAGERIGYVAIHPEMEDAKLLFEALVFCNRVLGFVNAPALMQRVLPYLSTATGNADKYSKLRDLACAILKDAGFDFVTPKGTFYVFPKCPLSDDQLFVKLALEQGIMLVPGSGFGKPGHFRLSFSVTKEQLAEARPRFKQLFASCQNYVHQAA